jgi:tetratricopeptide (TPR) repeat protein
MSSAIDGTPQPVSFGYLAKEAALFVAFCYLLLFANTWRAYADYDLIRIGVVLLSAATGLWLVMAIARRWQAPAPLAGPLLLFLGIYLLAGLASIQPRRSLDEVWTAAMYVFGFALVAQLVSKGWPRELFVKTLLLAGLLLMGISCYLALGWYRSWLAAAPGQWIPDIAYRLPLANAQATYLYLMAFVVITRLAATRARLPRILLVLWLIPAAGLLFLTASRGGWLAAAVGLAVIGLAWMRDAGGLKFVREAWGRARARWQQSLGVAALGTLVLAGTGWAAAGQITNPQKTFASQARVEYWVPAWRTFLQRPLLGQGPLTFGSAYLRENSVPPYGFFAHAHSIFFNLLSETGAAGVAAFGILAVTAFVALWLQVDRLAGHDRAVAVAALAGAAAWAAHSLVDSVNVEPMNSTLMAVLLGAALGPLAGASRPGIERRWVPVLRAGWPAILGGVLAVAGWYNVWRIAPLHEGVQAANRADWAGARTHFEEALRRDPQSVIAHQQAGLVYALQAEAGDQESLQRAITEFEAVVSLDPDWWLNHANLAALYLAGGDAAGAVEEFRAAVALGSGSPLLQLNYGLAAEEAGQTGEARAAYLRALDLRPDWAGAYFWRAGPFRAEVLREWRSLSPALPVLTPAQMLRLADGADRASQYTPQAAEYLRLGRLDEADRLLQKASLAHVDLGEAGLELDWLKAELRAGRGDLRTAADLGRQAIEGYFLASSFGPGTFAATSYAQVFFRQESMAIELVPQLTPAPFTDRWAGRLVRLGDWSAALGEAAGAEAAYQRVLGLVPDNAAAAERLER